MKLLSFSDTPFRIHLSFYQVIEKLEKLAEDPATEGSDTARLLLQELAAFPELRYGITDESQVVENAELIRRLLTDYFPPALTQNEIKAINIPYSNIIFNHTERFRKILQAAGPDFSINIRNFDEHQLYVFSCCIILNEYYGTKLDFSKPLFYDIPTADGVTKHYRILYNADYLDIQPTENSISLSPDDIDLLVNNYDDLPLWKEKFPPESWLLKGFAIMTLYDATVENAVSILKEKLIGLKSEDIQKSIEAIFQSIYKTPDLKVGFSFYNQEEGMLSMETFSQQIHSFILKNNNSGNARELLCMDSYRNLVEHKHYFAVSDTAEFVATNPESRLVSQFLSQNIQSFILAPVVKNNLLLGVLEVVSIRPKELNSINANKLDVVMPFLTDSIERMVAEMQNQVQAVIQEKYTAIHASVYWKFRSEAQSYVSALQVGQNYALKEIVFPDVFPLYGQIDIQGSSESRNSSAQKDVQKQLKALLSIVELINKNNLIESFNEEEQQLNSFLKDCSFPLPSGEEQVISNFMDSHIHPRIRQLSDPDLTFEVSKYFSATHKQTGAFHTYRRMYEKTVTMINDKMISIIDSKQSVAQAILPHYYERFKSDGVEHNLYIGPSISPSLEFDLEKLHALRLWQLEVLCEMENAHYQLKPFLPYQLDVTSLILVQYSTISIRFRMDEKRFDVDGSYNARFEILKKRIDKAHIKNTTERITQAGKLTIVYSNETEEQEYLKYIQILQSRNLLDEGVERLVVEDLQGVSGLKILRVKFLH